MATLRKRTFETADSTGCNFLCTAYYQTEWNGRTKVTNHRYVACGMSMESDCLKTLKQMVGEL